MHFNKFHSTKTKGLVGSYQLYCVLANPKEESCY